MYYETRGSDVGPCSFIGSCIGCLYCCDWDCGPCDCDCEPCDCECEPCECDTVDADGSDCNCDC